MGSTQSKSTDAGSEETRRRELADRGVLVPPLFVVGTGSTGNSGSGTTGSTSNGENQDEQPSPSLLTRLQHESLSHSILTRYLNPGLCITSFTNASAKGSVSASLIPTQTANPDASMSSTMHTCTDSHSDSALSVAAANAVLRISQRFMNKVQLDLWYATNSHPTLAAALLVTPSLKLSSTMDAQGAGWLACQYRMSVNADTLFQTSSSPQHKLHFHFGTWLDLDASKERSGAVDQQWRLSTLTTNNISAANAYASLQVPGCILAVQGRLPNTFEQLPDLSYFASADLTTDGPPLTVTLTKTPKSSSLGFSQTIQWDRWVLNPVEVACPKIRNTLCWTVELETTKPGDDAKNDTTGRISVPKAGMVWQFNRGIAFKVVAQPKLTGAIIVKRWKQPKIVCSVLFGQGPSFGRALEFQGLGLHLEIGDSDATTPEKDMDQESPRKPTMVSPRVPPTLATLPDDNSFQYGGKY